MMRGSHLRLFPCTLPQILLTFCLLTLCFILGGANQAYAQPKAAAKAIEAIRIYQTHFFMGTTQITIAPNAIRIDNTAQLRFILIAKAPDWKVTVFRLDDKSYFSEDLKTFEDGGLISDMIIGRKERYLRDRPARTSAMKLNGFTVMRVTSRWTTVKYLKLEKIAAPEVERILYAVFKMATNGGIPIAYTGTHQDADFLTGMKNTGRLENSLETSKIEKVSVSPGFFTVPSGLKKVGSIREVVVGHTNTKKSEAAEIMLEK